MWELKKAGKGRKWYGIVKIVPPSPNSQKTTLVSETLAGEKLRRPRTVESFLPVRGRDENYGSVTDH